MRPRVGMTTPRVAIFTPNSDHLRHRHYRDTTLVFTESSTIGPLASTRLPRGDPTPRFSMHTTNCDETTMQ